MAKGLYKISGTYYFFNKKNGAMKTNGCQKISDKLYYFSSNGKAHMSEGWFTGSDKKVRYSLGSGVVATGTKKVGDWWYEFSATTGERLKKLGDDSDRKIRNVSSNTSYLVTVNLKTYELRVYTGSQKNWTRIKTYSCTIGEDKTPTDPGTFTINRREDSNKATVDGVKVRHWYDCFFNGKRAIHSGLYYDDKSPKKPYDTTLGQKKGNGDVRVSLDAAAYIYYNVPMYTTVYIY